jgi:queuosine precursor transporter
MKTIHKLENHKGYTLLLVLSMLYMSIMLCSAVLTNRYIGIDSIFVLGGTLISPLVFVMDDIIAEIYGYKITRNLILAGYASQIIFTLICQLVVIAPHPSFFKQQNFYEFILGTSLLRISLSGFIAYITANLINSYIITRWKVLLKGKHFWLRSLGSSAFSEALYSFFAILMMELNTIPFHDILKVVAISYSIKLSYNVLLAGPATLLVGYIKKVTGIDVYDFPKNFTPFKYVDSKANAQAETEQYD